jgi:hypothetical protein
MRAFVRSWRVGVLVAVPALAALGLAGLPSLAGAATGQPPPAPAGATAVAPGASAPASPHFVSPLPAPALPAGISQGCATPAQAGQMQCDVLVNTKARPHAAITPNAIPPGSGYTPAQLQAAYGLALAAAASNTGTVAIVDAYNDPNAAKDLTQYRKDAGLPICTGCLKIVNQTGGATLPGADPTGGWEIEESTDLDMVSAICPHCKILLVEAKSASPTDLVQAENYAASHAKFVSNSWGSGVEFIGENSSDSAFNHPGVVITAASGDFGYGTQWPAASHLVTSVGGTTLTQDSSSRGWTEAAWAGSGSGCSTLEPKPAWQTDTNATTGCLNRTENDVSAVADPNTGVAVYDTYPSTVLGVTQGYNQLGGTSVATPIITSVYALAGTPRPGTYPSSYPYQHTSAFNQIASGSNGACESTRSYLCDATGSLAGYNGPTGWGTPIGIAGFSEATTGNVVTVLNPGTVDIENRATLTLPIHAVDSVSTQKLTYTAAGLPSGLTISKTTGAITGTDKGATGTASVTVKATDSTAANGSVTFKLATVASMQADYHAAAGTVRLALGGKCLDDANSRTTNGNKIQIFTCRGASQTWAFDPGGNPGGTGTLNIYGKCLDIAHAGTANGSKLDLWTCTGGANQRWFLDGFGVLVNPASGRCLDDPGNSTKNGTQVDISACTGASNQSWTLPASPVQSGVPGKCMDDTGNSAANGNMIEISTCSGGASQKWVLAADGTLRINGKCLDVAGQSLLDGALIQLSACTSNQPSQQWLVGPNGELINANSGRCLDDPGASTVNGTQLDQQDCYGNVSEVWLAT